MLSAETTALLVAAGIELVVSGIDPLSVWVRARPWYCFLVRARYRQAWRLD
jgi:hypothetical protein